MDNSCRYGHFCMCLSRIWTFCGPEMERYGVAGRYVGSPELPVSRPRPRAHCIPCNAMQQLPHFPLVPHLRLTLLAPLVTWSWTCLKLSGFPMASRNGTYPCRGSSFVSPQDGGGG